VEIISFWKKVKRCMVWEDRFRWFLVEFWTNMKNDDLYQWFSDFFFFIYFGWLGWQIIEKKKWIKYW